MHWIDYVIVLVPLCAVFGLAFYSKRYVRGVADFLAAGRVAGRYVISVGDMSAAMSIITVISLVESQYQSGLGITFWNNLLIPVTIFLSLTGFVLYRYRQTRSLSLGQFLEMRYNRPFRIIAAALRTVSEAMANTIGPAVASRFFIYMLGIPMTFTVGSMEFQTFPVVMLILLVLALMLIWPGGRISLLVTDALQGLMSYPIFVIMTCFILSELSWSNDIAPVLVDRVAGESFINPNDIQSLRDFNLFALIVLITSRILNRGAWIGNDTSGSGKTPHEQKMAGILGAWRIGFSTIMMSMIALFVITIMQGKPFAEKSRVIREELISRISSELIDEPAVRKETMAAVKAVPVALPEGKYSRKHNADTAYFEAVRNTLNNNAERQIAASGDALDKDAQADIRGESSAKFQEFRTLYYQVMAPVILSKELPPGIFGMFLLLMAMLLLSTDDSRIFNAASTIVQDVVMPLRSRPFEKKEHLMWLRGMSILIAASFFIASFFLAQLDYITMFINITCALWQGAAGPIIIGGLYTRWGNTKGAFASLICGSGTAFFGFFCQRTWSSTIYPFLEAHGMLDGVNTIFAFVTKWCSPLVVWEMSADKFPINSYEISFIAMIIGIASYVIGSFIGRRESYNLDRLLHRGEYADEKSVAPAKKSIIAKLVGITPDYTKGDRIIAWSVFGYAIIWQFFIAFAAVAIWNAISPLSTEAWNWYFFITIAVVGVLVGLFSTVWFMWGGIRDLRRLFVDLKNRVENPLDAGWVEGQVSLADQEKFAAKDGGKEHK